VRPCLERGFAPIPLAFYCAAQPESCFAPRPAAVDFHDHTPPYTSFGSHGSHGRSSVQLESFFAPLATVWHNWKVALHLFQPNRKVAVLLFQRGLPRPKHTPPLPNGLKVALHLSQPNWKVAWHVFQQPWTFILLHNLHSPLGEAVSTQVLIPTQVGISTSVQSPVGEAVLTQVLIPTQVGISASVQSPVGEAVSIQVLLLHHQLYSQYCWPASTIITECHRMQSSHMGHSFFFCSLARLARLARIHAFSPRSEPCGSLAPQSRASDVQTYEFALNLVIIADARSHEIITSIPIK
jgi:hypothetical protein